MLFDIQDSVGELFNSGVYTEADLESLKLLLQGCMEGNHRLSGSRSCLYKLARVSSLSGRMKRCVENALARYSEEAKLSYKLSTVGRVENTMELVPRVSFSGAQRLINFPLRWFDSMSRVQPVTLLGENLSDAKVLRFIGEVGSVLAGLRYLPFTANLDGGGGSAIGQTLGHLADQQTLCVCVVDSDKKSPGSAIGSTASAIAKFKNHGLFPTLQVNETGGRDLENLLPDSFYLAKYGHHIVYRGLAGLLNQASSIGEIDIRSFVDVEKGLKLYDCRVELAGAQDPNFWKEKESILMLMSGASPSCQHIDHCPKNNRRECTCDVSPGIPTNVLEDFLQYASEKSRFELSSSLSTSIRSEWQYLGTDLASWCCGDSRVRV